MARAPQDFKKPLSIKGSPEIRHMRHEAKQFSGQAKRE